MSPALLLNMSAFNDSSQFIIVGSQIKSAKYILKLIIILVGHFYDKTESIRICALFAFFVYEKSIKYLN